MGSSRLAWWWTLAALALPARCAFSGQYLDYQNAPPDAALASVVAECNRAIAELVARSEADEPPFEAAADKAVAVPPPEGERGLSIAYLVMAGRNYAQYTVPRLLRALFSPDNLFLIHADAKLDEGTLDELRQFIPHRPNIHYLSRRRHVGWGAFSMVEVLLDALATAVRSGSAFDFFINLSDSDLPLRTHAEIVAFLAPFRGTSFVAVKDRARDDMRYRSHAHMRRFAFAECSGRGFAVLNGTADALFGAGRGQCCLARSGPILYTGSARLAVPRVPEGVEVFHGSQWAILSRPFSAHLALAAAGVRPPAAHAEPPSPHEPAELEAAAGRLRGLLGALRFSYMADESILQTALLDSPFSARAVSHNLRYIDWPVGQESVTYWQRLGRAHAAGPRVLTEADLPALVASEAMFARKVDPHVDKALVSAWDALMAGKLQGEHPAEQPPIGASLLQHDPGLATSLRPPRTRAQREAGEAEVPPHALHYGREDILAEMVSSKPRPAVQESARRLASEAEAGADAGASATTQAPACDAPGASTDSSAKRQPWGWLRSLRWQRGEP